MIMRHSYYSVRQFYHSKLKFIDKFTHFIINIGDFVNKTACVNWQSGGFNILSLLDLLILNKNNTFVGIFKTSPWSSLGVEAVFLQKT